MAITSHFNVNYGQSRNDYCWPTGSSYSLEDSRVILINNPASHSDLGVVICGYCGSRYLYELVKSQKITNCMGCGAVAFHFEKG